MLWDQKIYGIAFKYRKVSSDGMAIGGLNQSQYREVPRWEIFMKQELTFGLDLGRLALLKKTNIWADHEQLLRLVFMVKRKINK